MYGYQIRTHIAATCIANIGLYAHIMCRLPFGAKAAPQEWCIGFEIYIDLVNELLTSLDWESSELPTPDSARTPTTQRQPPLV